MIISVSGTQCVGKSTFIKDFLENYKLFKTPEIDYRKIILENNLNLNRNGDYRSQKILIDFILNQTIELSKSNDFYILDRSMVDVFAYSSWLYKNKISSGFTAENIIEMYNLLLDNLRLYDMMLFIPLKKNNHVKIEDDKFRDTDEEYRKQIDNLFVKTFNEISNKIKIYELFGDRSSRIDQLKNINIYER